MDYCRVTIKFEASIWKAQNYRRTPNLQKVLYLMLRLVFLFRHFLNDRVGIDKEIDSDRILLLPFVYKQKAMVVCIYNPKI